MGTNASFWDDPEAKDNTPVVRHAPDSSNYHYPDQEQLAKMRGSKVGRFAVIPAANKDGTSKAFDPTVAGPVHVDPDAPDGGVIFDASSVRKSDINRAVNAATYAHQAFYQLGTPAPLLGIGRNKAAASYGGNLDADRGPNPHMPNTYVVPAAPPPTFVANGVGPGPESYNPQFRAQEEQSVNPVPNALPSIGEPRQVAQPAPQPAPYPQPEQRQAYATPPMQYPQAPQPQYYAPPQAYAPPAMDPNLAAVMQGMVGLQQTVAALAKQVAQPPLLPPTTGVSQVPMPRGRPVGLSTTPRTGSGDDDFDTARPIRKQARRARDDEDEPQEERSLVRRAAQDEDRKQTVEDVERSQQEQEGVIYGFEALDLKFVTGPLPNKAKRQVIFEIPGAGKHMARFHDVIDSEECLVLVYDTRYEEGQQYVPPELGETVITVHLPKEKKSFRVSSMGFNYSFGVFDHIVLIKNHNEGDESGYDGEK